MMVLSFLEMKQGTWCEKSVLTSLVGNLLLLRNLRKYNILIRLRCTTLVMVVVATDPGFSRWNLPMPSAVTWTLRDLVGVPKLGSRTTDEMQFTPRSKVVSGTSVITYSWWTSY